LQSWCSKRAVREGGGKCGSPASGPVPRWEPWVRLARAARDRLSEAVAHLDGRLGKVATVLEDAEHLAAFGAAEPKMLGAL
jgi:hypothetical protein